VFEPFGLVVDLEPLHSEHFGEHALDEVVSKQEPVGNLPAGFGQGDPSLFCCTDQSVALQSSDARGHRGRGNLEPSG